MSESTKREVWELAKDGGLSDFISKVSAAFPDAIKDVSVTVGGVTKYTGNQIVEGDKVAVVTRYNKKDEPKIIPRTRGLK